MDNQSFLQQFHGVCCSATVFFVILHHKCVLCFLVEKISPRKPKITALELIKNNFLLLQSDKSDKTISYEYFLKVQIISSEVFCEFVRNAF